MGVYVMVIRYLFAKFIHTFLIRVILIMAHNKG
jgi:hypothetical protein